MSSLKRCLKKIGLSKHEAAILRGAIKDYMDTDGIAAHEAAVKAVEDHIEELSAERADIVAQIEKQGGAVEAVQAPEPAAEKPVAYATRKEAQRVARLGDIKQAVIARNEKFYVVEVPKRERSPQQKANDARLSARRNNIDPQQDSLFAAIGKLGGLNRAAAASEWGVDPKDRAESGVIGKPVLRANGGLSVDGMAEALGQYGYLPLDEHGKVDLRDFGDLFDKELRGEKVYAAEGVEHQAEKARAEEDAQHLADALEQEGIAPSAETIDNADLIAQAQELDPDRFERLTMEYAHRSDEDFRAAVQELIDEHHRRNAANNQGGEKAVRAGQARAAEARPALQLAAETPAEVIARQEALAAAAKQKAADEANAAAREKRAANKAEQDRRAAEVLAEREAAKKAEIEAARENFALGQEAPKPVVKKVSTEEAAGQGDVFEGPKFQRAGRPSALTQHALRLQLQPILKNWKNAPTVTFHDSITDPSVPAAIKTEDTRQRLNGATGRVEGVYYKGAVHLFADAISSPDRAVIVLLHETIGHAGLRGVFGDNLKLILHQIANVRKADVALKAKQYGLDMSNPNERLKAAEEWLADMAATRPEIGFVRRAIAEIRRFLRKLGVRLELTDDEIIHNFLIPAREHIEGGKRGATDIAGAMAFHRAWHGSPHDFDQFKLQHIGTGEGAAAYGWGAYFASNRAVAEYYKDALTRTVPGASFGKARYSIRGIPFPEGRAGHAALDTALEMDSLLGYTQMGAQEMVDTVKRGIENRIKYWKQHPGTGVGYEHMADLVDYYEKYVKNAIKSDVVAAPRGRLYQVELAPTLDQYLDWDKPLSEQSEKVRTILNDALAEKISRSTSRGMIAEYDSGKRIAPNTHGAALYHWLAQNLGSDRMMGLEPKEWGPIHISNEEAASRYLNSIGIPGIKYLDQSSRNKGEGTHNFVIFDDSHINIEAKFSRSAEAAPGTPEAALGHMNGPAPLAAARSLMDDITHSDRVLNRVISKANTPFHIAETNPEFKPVYDETQNFLHDVSRVATEAADLAPDILPRIEKFADFAKRAPTNADIQAVAAAVHAGTLYEGGNPLAGMKWTDDELRGKETVERPFPQGMPKLTEKQIGLYHQHLDSVAHSLQEHSKSLIWRLARQAKDERGQGITLKPGDSLEVMAEAARTEADRRIEARRLQAESLVDTDNATSEKLAKLHDQIKELQAFKDSVNDIEDKTDKLIEHGYSPLMRFGQYAVNVASRDKNGAWHEEYFGRFDTQMAANVARKEIERDPQYKGMSITSGVMNPDLYKLFQGLNLDALQLFAEHMKDENGVAIAKDPIMQQAFRIATAERSVMKRQIHRKGTPGYSQDMARILSQFTTSTARSTSTNYHGAAMLSAAQQIKAGDLQGYATRYVRYVNDPAEESQALRGFLANYYILGSLAFGAVNMTQPVFVTAPYLSQSTSWTNAMAQLGKASLDYARGMRGLPTDEAKAYNKARQEGIIAPQEIHQIRAEGQATMFGDSPLWNKLSSVAQSAGIPLPSRLLMRKLSFVWGSIYSLTEQFNRGTTFLAAYRIAKANGEANPYDVASQAVAATQFTYNKGNRPEISRGNIGSVIMTFKQFNISYLELARRLYTRDKKAFAILMLTLMALAGTEGLPFAEDIEDLIDTIGQWMGFGTNSKKRVRQFAVSMLGRDMADVMLHGTSAIPGIPIDVAQRMGMHNLIPGSAMLKSSEPDKSRDILELLGPAATLWKNGMTATQAIATGQFGGAKVLLPNALQNLAKGVDMVETGTYRDSKGKKVMDVDSVDAFSKMVGFQPANVARENRVITQNMQDISMQKVAEDSIAARWAQGIAEKDTAMVDKARAELRQWNTDNPELRVMITPAQIINRVRAMKMSREERFVKAAPREIRQGVRQEFVENRQ